MKTSAATPAQTRVLVVDDDALVRSACAALLRDWGYEVVEAEDGLDALTKLRAEAVDGVLLDVNMPRMRGDEMLAALERSSSCLPVLVMSSEDHEIKRKVLQLGARGFLAKPFAAAQLRAEIARLLA
jgi:CheY-like chemotaxis protein